MNFTREPIIETIITPREGYKLLVKNSKGGSNEEYSVDAVEVVSFGHSFFFRSMERPKSFLVPVSDYEIVEVKETRVVLKSPVVDKAIKIGGGKAEPGQAPAAIEQRLEKKRERRRHRRRRGAEVKEAEEAPEIIESPLSETLIEPTEAPAEPTIVAKQAAPSATLRRLIPPPTQLISETLVKVRDAMLDASEEPAEEPVEKEKPKAKTVRKSGRKTAKRASKEEKDPPVDSGEGGEVKRVTTDALEQVTTTSFSTVEPDPFGSDLF